MGDITEYERRIAVALDRIARGLDRVGGAAAAGDDGAQEQIQALEEALDAERRSTAGLAQMLADRDAELAELRRALAAGGAPQEGADTAGLHEALEAERASNAQLVERVRSIKEKQDHTIGTLEKRVARLSEQLEAGGVEGRRLRRVNGQLRESNQQLRHAVATGLADPGMIDHALKAELEALQALRAAEAAEMDEILAELKPLIAPGTGEAGGATIMPFQSRENSDA